jgi:hypothetical protein
VKIVKKVGERLLPSWLRTELRPILVFTGAGAALWAGSCELARRSWTALGERLDRWERLGALAIGGYVTVYACAHAPQVARFAVPVAVVGWCVAAWCVAPPAPVEHEQLADEGPAARDPQEVYEGTLEWIRGQIGTGNGVHLSRLLAHAQAHGMHTDLDVPAFRAALEQWGFPVRQQLKVGRRNRPGIHRDDLPQPPLPGPSPEESEAATTAAEYLP